MPGDDILKQETAWLKTFCAQKYDIILDRARGPFGFSQCFGIAQRATIESGGRLLYHEGHADDKITGKKFQRHAWNTFLGEIVDLSETQNPEDGSCTGALGSYENYTPEKSCTVEEVRTVLAQRNGRLDWIVKPEYPEHVGKSGGCDADQ
jgi:hypothetical protein